MPGARRRSELITHAFDSCRRGRGADTGPMFVKYNGVLRGLDADQPVPWADQPLSYFMKYRLYFQEYAPERHKLAYDYTWGIGGETGEYDVPRCADGTPVERCTHEIGGVALLPQMPSRCTTATSLSSSQTRCWLVCGK